MHKTIVINAVGLTESLLSAATPRLTAFARAGKLMHIGPVTPAVTCSVQATYLTGTWPDEHGIVGNGWYDRDDCEIKFWKQANKLVQGSKIWDRAKALDPRFTCANHFWWFNMYSSADFTVTPRPMYPADGRKLPDCYTHPASLREELQSALGQFPLFKFWGPATDIGATQWIADAAVHIDRKHNPTLTLIYLPHLDYCLQRVGPAGDIKKDLADLDRICGHLIDHYTQQQARIIVLSEYGIVPVNQPVHLNRVLRQNGLLTMRVEQNRELLDAGASAAFAVADHQVAHIYLNDPLRIGEVRQLIESTPGVARVAGAVEKTALHLDHPRAGELVALAEPHTFFTYYYWLDDARMPDFARTVDIHRKPGYDPAELFLDPALRFPKLKIARTLLKRKLGMRSLLEVIPANADQIRGSHGLPMEPSPTGPMLISNQPRLLNDVDHPAAFIAAPQVHDCILRHLLDNV